MADPKMRLAPMRASHTSRSVSASGGPSDSENSNKPFFGVGNLFAIAALGVLAFHSGTVLLCGPETPACRVYSQSVISTLFSVSEISITFRCRTMPLGARKRAAYRPCATRSTFVIAAIAFNDPVSMFRKSSVVSAGSFTESLTSCGTLSSDAATTPSGIPGIRVNVTLASSKQLTRKPFCCSTRPPVRETLNK